MTHGRTRRDFLRGTAGAAIGAALGLSGTGRQARAQAGPRVVLIRSAEALADDGAARPEVVRALLDEACAALAGEGQTASDWWKARFAAGDRVGLKANVMMNHTRPEILLALHDSLAEHVGVATEAVAAWDRGSGAFGREELAKPDREWHPDPRLSFDDDAVSRLASEWATALINVPSLKCHWLSGVAIALKNWCGAVTRIRVDDAPGTAFQFHGDSCANLGVFQKLPALGGKCRLVVVDAMEPYYAAGPQTDPEYFHRYGGLIVGTDAVAVDAVGAHLLQAIRDHAAGEPSPISPPPKHIAVAAEQFGLGVSDLARIDLVRLGDTDGMLV